MKKLVLLLGLMLVCPLVAMASEVSVPAVAGVTPAAADFDLSQLFPPAAENKATQITWSGGTCTAWLYCPGEPYWKCQSTTGNCQHDNCSITCNGYTRSCPTRPGQAPCVPF